VVVSLLGGFIADFLFRGLVVDLGCPTFGARVG
jgi:hypothetical protein